MDAYLDSKKLLEKLRPKEIRRKRGNSLGAPGPPPPDRLLRSLLEGAGT
jgi:hypothetical protein